MPSDRAQISKCYHNGIWRRHWCCMVDMLLDDKVICILRVCSPLALAYHSTRRMNGEESADRKVALRNGRNSKNNEADFSQRKQNYNLDKSRNKKQAVFWPAFELLSYIPRFHRLCQTRYRFRLQEPLSSPLLHCLGCFIREICSIWRSSVLCSLNGMAENIDGNSRLHSFGRLDSSRWCNPACPEIKTRPSICTILRHSQIGWENLCNCTLSWPGLLNFYFLSEWFEFCPEL